MESAESIIGCGEKLASNVLLRASGGLKALVPSIEYENILHCVCDVMALTDCRPDSPALKIELQQS